MIVREGDRLTEARLAWREGSRGRMRPALLVGSHELPPGRVEVVEATEDQAEALAAAGFNVAK